MVESEAPFIVIDNGSGFIKEGFSGEELPKSVFPSVLGRPRRQNTDKDYYIGNEALK